MKDVQISDLLRWWIFYRWQETPSEIITPELFGEWVSEVYQDATKHPEMIAKLAEQYIEFAEEFQIERIEVGEQSTNFNCLATHLFVCSLHQ